METLRELVQIVTRNKLKAIDVLDLKAETDTKISKLYKIVAEEKVDSDDSAAGHLNPGAKNTAGYRKVKARLKSRLLGALFFIDAKKPDYHDRKRAYYQSYRDWAAARILMAKNAFVSSLELAQKVLRIAEKYEFTELAMESTRFLRLYYSTKEGNRKRFEYYHQKFVTYQQQYLAECELEYFYSDLLIPFVNKKSSGSEMQSRINTYYEQCLPRIQQYQTYNIQLYGMLIGLMVHSSRQDYRATLELCEKATILFENKPYLAGTPLQVIYYQSLVCHIQLRNYEKGRIAANSCLSLIEEGTFNWFKYQELHFLLCMHTKRYIQAAALLRKINGHNRFPYLMDNAKEVWKIYEAYAFFARWATDQPEGLDQVNFKLSRFLNEIPIFSRDKKGLNVAILIAQFLLLLKEERYGEMIDRAEALYKYGIRYLQEEESMRSFYFIKMLLALVHASFKPQKAEKTAQKYLEKMKSCPLAEAQQSHQIEIIPYESIWTMILHQLQRSNQSVSS